MVTTHSTVREGKPARQRYHSDGSQRGTDGLTIQLSSVSPMIGLMAPTSTLAPTLAASTLAMVGALMRPSPVSGRYTTTSLMALPPTLVSSKVGSKPSSGTTALVLIVGWADPT